jgi:Domain of unknown function (DUF4760)
MAAALALVRNFDQENAMGMGPFNDPENWRSVGARIMDGLDAVSTFLTNTVPYAPLITATVATIAGGIAYYSIHVTRTVARRRAAIDFFLKTEADKSIVDIFQRFDESLQKVNDDIDAGKALAEITKTPHYKDIHTCLNIHELLAIGVANKVFDERVAYHYWSAALVGHKKKAAKLINFSRESPDDYSAYIGMLELSNEWEKELVEWASRQPPVPRKAIMVQGPATPTALDPNTQPPTETP